MAATKSLSPAVWGVIVQKAAKARRNTVTRQCCVQICAAACLVEALGVLMLAGKQFQAHEAHTALVFCVRVHLQNALLALQACLP